MGKLILNGIEYSGGGGGGGGSSTLPVEQIEANGTYSIPFLKELSNDVDDDALYYGSVGTLTKTLSGNTLTIDGDMNVGNIETNRIDASDLTVTGYTYFEGNTLFGDDSGYYVYISSDGNMEVSLNLEVGGSIEVGGDLTLDAANSFQIGGITIEDNDITLSDDYWDSDDTYTSLKEAIDAALSGGGGGGDYENLGDLDSAIGNNVFSVDPVTGDTTIGSNMHNISIYNGEISRSSGYWTYGIDGNYSLRDELQSIVDYSLNIFNTTYGKGSLSRVISSYPLRRPMDNGDYVLTGTYKRPYGGWVNIDEDIVWNGTPISIIVDNATIQITSTTISASELSGDIDYLLQRTNGKFNDSVSVNQVQSSGTKIATITVNDTDTDLYAPAPGSVNHTEVSTGTYEVLLSNSSTGDVKKNEGLEYRVNDSTYGTLLKLESPHTSNADPWITVMKSYAANTYFDAVSIYKDDIVIEGNTQEQGFRYLTWDGVNTSLRTSLSTMILSGTTDPTSSIGREGSTYYKISNGTIVGIWIKFNGVWMPYVPPTPTPTPTSEWLYDWDFTDSLVDSVQGETAVINTTKATQSSSGVVFTDGGDDYDSNWVVKMPVDLLTPNKHVEIDFGNCDFFYQDFGSTIYVLWWSDDYSTPTDTGLSFSSDGYEMYAYMDQNPDSEGYQVAQEPYQNFLANSTLKIVTSMSQNNHLQWTVSQIVNDVETELFTTSDTTFWEWDDPVGSDAAWVVSGNENSLVTVTGLRIKNVTT